MSSNRTIVPPSLAAPGIAAFGFVVMSLLALVRLDQTHSLSAQPVSQPVSQPPIEAGAADAWLAARAERPMNPADPAWQDLSHHPGVVGAWPSALPSRPFRPAEAWALALFSLDAAWLDMTAKEAGLDMGLTGVLSQPSHLSAVAEGCPHVPASLLPLCDPSAREAARAALDTTLAAQLGSDDPVVAGFAMNAICTMGGPRGVAIGSAARDGVAAGPERRLQRIRGVVARACSLDEAAAIAELEAALDGDWELALVAATELARLEATGSAPAMDRLAARLGSNGDAVLVRYAAAVARGRGAEFADAVDGAGL
jgi:hypothetical protein